MAAPGDFLLEAHLRREARARVLHGIDLQITPGQLSDC
jgi:hypothetical protein